MRAASFVITQVVRLPELVRIAKGIEPSKTVTNDETIAPQDRDRRPDLPRRLHRDLARAAPRPDHEAQRSGITGRSVVARLHVLRSAFARQL